MTNADVVSRLLDKIDSLQEQLKEPTKTQEQQDKTKD